MQHHNELDIRQALTGAGNLGRLKDERRSALLASTGVSHQDAALQGQRRAAAAAVSSLFSRAGAELEGGIARYGETLRRAADKSVQAAIEQSHHTKARLDAELQSRLKSLDAIVAADPTVASPQRVLLNRPFLIWPSQGLFLDSSEVVPSNSWAKFRMNSSASNGYGDVSFYFLWDNPTDKVAVINVNAYLVLHGTCQVGSGGGVLPGILSGDRYSQLWLTANMDLLEWWNQPPTRPYPQTDQSQQALFIHTNTGGWGSVGAIELQTVFRGYDLSYTLMLVPPRGVVVFDVAAMVSFSNADGAIAVDFASGGFQVTCPAVLVTILS
jgi:hypothetical protein